MVYEAEVTTVILTLHILMKLKKRLNRATIGTDNQAVLMGLRNQRLKPGHYLMDKVYDALEDIQVTQWNRGKQVKDTERNR